MDRSHPGGWGSSGLTPGAAGRITLFAGRSRVVEDEARPECEGGG
jgi:hypothetical protein